MYFPGFSFVPFLQTIHETVQGVVSISSLEEHSVEVCHQKSFVSTLIPYCTFFT